MASFASLFFDSAERRRSSRLADPAQAERDRHVRAIALKLSGHYRVAQVAALEGVHEATLRRWQSLIRAGAPYTGPEAEAIRRLLKNRAAGRRPAE